MSTPSEAQAAQRVAAHKRAGLLAAGRSLRRSLDPRKARAPHAIDAAIGARGPRARTPDADASPLPTRARDAQGASTGHGGGTHERMHEVPFSSERKRTEVRRRRGCVGARVRQGHARECARTLRDGDATRAAVAPSPERNRSRLPLQVYRAQRRRRHPRRRAPRACTRRPPRWRRPRRPACRGAPGRVVGVLTCVSAVRSLRQTCAGPRLGWTQAPARWTQRRARHSSARRVCGACWRSGALELSFAVCSSCLQACDPRASAQTHLYARRGPIGGASTESCAAAIAARATSTPTAKNGRHHAPREEWSTGSARSFTCSSRIARAACRSSPLAGPRFRCQRRRASHRWRRSPASTPSWRPSSTRYANDERKRRSGRTSEATRRADGGATDPGVAFAGLGDPLLRWPDVAEITRRVREHHEVPISLYTNGLLPPDAPPPPKLPRPRPASFVSFDLRRGDGVPSTPLPAQDAARGRRHRLPPRIERGGPGRLRARRCCRRRLRAGVPR